MIKLLKTWIEMIVALFRVLTAQPVEKLPYKLNLQYFSGEDGDDDKGGDDDDDQDDQDGDSEDDDDQDDEQSLEQMMKDDPKIKKQFNQLFKSKFDKRLKGVAVVGLWILQQSLGPNLVIQDNWIRRSASASKYKTDIEAMDLSGGYMLTIS